MRYDPDYGRGGCHSPTNERKSIKILKNAGGEGVTLIGCGRVGELRTIIGTILEEVNKKMFQAKYISFSPWGFGEAY